MQFKIPDDPKDFLFLILGILILFYIIWLYTGGPERTERENPFIRPPSPIGDGKTYGL